MNTVHLSALYCLQVVTNPANVTFMQLLANILGVIHSFFFLHSFTCFLLPHSNASLKYINLNLRSSAEFPLKLHIGSSHSHPRGEKKNKIKRKKANPHTGPPTLC